MVLLEIPSGLPATVVSHWCELGSHTGDLRDFMGLPNAVQHNNNDHHSDKEIELVVTSNLQNPEVTQIDAIR